MRETVERTIAENHLLERGDRVLVAVSGGADSVALLAGLRALASLWGIQLEVAHLDHRLRDDSVEDAHFVERLARTWGLPVTVASVDAGAYARSHRLSIEAAARDVRYAFLSRTANERGCNKVAVGHTADDQAETLLLRILRGARPGGMRTKRALGERVLIRPMLDVWRSDVRAFLQQEGLRWREDPSNLDKTRLRNRIRHDLIPTMQGYIPQVRLRLKQTADVLAAEDEVLEAAATEAQARLVRAEGGAVLLSRGKLLQEPLAIRQRVIRRAIATAAGTIRRLKFVHVEEVLRLAGAAAPGRLDLPGLAVVVRGDDVILLRRVKDEVPPAAEYVVPLHGRLEATSLGLIIESEICSSELVNFGDGAVYLDADKVGSTPRLRAWRPGDRFRPIGMMGTKKVGDFLTDVKAPPEVRRRVPVVVAEDGTIVWVVGWRVAEEARVTSQTRRILRMAIRSTPGAGLGRPEVSRGQGSSASTNPL